MAKKRKNPNRLAQGAAAMALGETVSAGTTKTALKAQSEASKVRVAQGRAHLAAERASVPQFSAAYRKEVGLRRLAEGYDAKAAKAVTVGKVARVLGRGAGVGGLVLDTLIPSPLASGELPDSLGLKAKPKGMR